MPVTANQSADLDLIFLTGARSDSITEYAVITTDRAIDDAGPEVDEGQRRIGFLVLMEDTGQHSVSPRAHFMVDGDWTDDALEQLVDRVATRLRDDHDLDQVTIRVYDATVSGRWTAGPDGALDREEAWQVTFGQHG